MQLKRELRGRKVDIGVGYERIHIQLRDNIEIFLKNVIVENKEQSDYEWLIRRFGLNVKSLKVKKEDFLLKNPEGCDKEKLLEELKKNVAEQIKVYILKLYNAEIDDYFVTLFKFCDVYMYSVEMINSFIKECMPIKPCSKEIEQIIKDRQNEFVVIEEVAKWKERSNVKSFDECVSKMFVACHNKMVAFIQDNNKDCEVSKIIEYEQDFLKDCVFLGLIKKDKFDIDVSFWSEWNYYPVNDMFKNIIAELNSQETKKTFIKFHDKEKIYFDKLKNVEVDFKSIDKKNIVTDGKTREVYYVKNDFERLVVRYIQSRLNQVFKIKYPNRDMIMEKCITLIDSLTDLEEYTIYRFDFENFFESIDVDEFYKRYIRDSELKRFEKELLSKLIEKFYKVESGKAIKFCPQGLGTSNAITEIIARGFDSIIRSEFIDDGLICYERYVDDGILIFNRKVCKDNIERILNENVKKVFGDRLMLQSTKSKYQTKRNNSTDSEFDFLGYKIVKICDKNPYMQFGIAQKKIEKYKREIENIFDLYEEDLLEVPIYAEELLRHRIQYMNARIVFYSSRQTGFVPKKWDVYGIINNYRMLRAYIQNDQFIRKESKLGKTLPQFQIKVCDETQEFLLNAYYEECEKRKSTGTITKTPYYLKKGMSQDYSLWNSFIYNRSIVFHRNIGWNCEYITKMLRKIGVRGSLKKYSYIERVKKYCKLMRK